MMKRNDPRRATLVDPARTQRLLQEMNDQSFEDERITLPPPSYNLIPTPEQAAYAWLETL